MQKLFISGKLCLLGYFMALSTNFWTCLSSFIIWIEWILKNPLNLLICHRMPFTFYAAPLIRNVRIRLDYNLLSFAFRSAIGREYSLLFSFILLFLLDYPIFIGDISRVETRIQAIRRSCSRQNLLPICSSQTPTFFRKWVTFTMHHEEKSEYACETAMLLIYHRN